MSSYDLKQVLKRYGERTVLYISHLEIKSGRSLVLLGPSGAGKSTLLRLLNFLETPSEGTISFDGQRVGAEGPTLATQRSITTLFQRSTLLNGTVWNNVAYGLWLRGERDPARVEALLARVGMLDRARAVASTLSGGEAQRVALARALVIEPQVLLLDEPTATLDPANVAQIEQIIQELRQGSTTLVIVTHHLFQARRLADDAALLIGGELVEAGEAESFFEQPRDARAAAFLTGKMLW
ncbi:MAG: phosphate ABC transporter ATP-binding protein [Ardenticatenales bacterium]|nr:phosphate ABC transporter ATP-binding protein [Ardenticatenales bacterium]